MLKSGMHEIKVLSGTKSGLPVLLGISEALLASYWEFSGAILLEELRLDVDPVLLSD